MAGEWANTQSKNALTPSYVQQLPTIQQIELYLQRKGKATCTIETYIKALKELAKRADLNNTAEIELAIAKYTKQNGEPATGRWKNQMATAYTHYCKIHKIEWQNKPHYQIDEKSIQPPTHERMQMLMTSAKSTLSLKISIIIETGLRPCEVTGDKGLKAKDIHPDQKTITPSSAKSCNSRPAPPISPELTARLQTYITKRNLKPEDSLFTQTPDGLSNTYRKMRNRLADRLNDQSIRSTRLYDMRHAYVTNKLRKIQNVEIVRQIIGHKRLNTTQKYMHLLADNNGEWITEGTTDTKRAKELLDNDFTYQLTTPDGTMLFRKRK